MCFADVPRKLKTITACKTGEILFDIMYIAVGQTIVDVGWWDHSYLLQRWTNMN